MKYVFLIIGFAFHRMEKLRGHRSLCVKATNMPNLEWIL